LAVSATHGASPQPNPYDEESSMNQRPIRKIALSRETVRILSPAQLAQAAGGAPTDSLTIGTTPFPSHGPCGQSAGRFCI
jgi:hypothetical protein